MYAYQLLAKLRLLTLAGYEDGEFIWLGKDTAWRQLAIEEEDILRANELNKIICK